MKLATHKAFRDLDYYPFGSVMNGRNYNAPNYKYGFNGQEKDDEVSGAGNTNTAEFWEYSSRLGRRYNLDPKPRPDYSPYSAFLLNPILNTDELGDIVEYEKFRDKVNALFARIFSSSFRHKFNEWKSKEEVYTIRKREGGPFLISGGQLKPVDATHIDVIYSNKCSWAPIMSEPEPKGELYDPVGTKGGLLKSSTLFEGHYKITDFHNASFKIRTFNISDKIELVSPGKPPYLVTNSATDDKGYTATNRDGSGEINVNLQKLYNEGKIGSEITVRITGNPKQGTAFDYKIKADEGEKKGYNMSVDKKGKILKP